MKELKFGDKLVSTKNQNVIYEFLQYIGHSKDLVKMTDMSYHDVKDLKLLNQ